MATASLSSTPTTIDDGVAITNWGGDTFSLNTSDHLEGSSCVECVQTINGNNDVYVTGTWDFSGTGSGDQHLRLWFLLTYVGNLSATNPIQVFLYDGTNTAYYYWDKGTSYTGGWAQAVIYTGDTPDSGTVNKASITRIGMRMATSTKPRNATWNALYDAWKYGDGYTVYGGTSIDPITWTDIATTDKTSAYSIVEEVNGVYFLRGNIQIGDGTNTTYFEPSGQVAVFVDEQVNTTLYNISFVDSATGLTNIDISGGAWSAGTLRYSIDASDTDLTTFNIDGLQLSNSGTISFQSGASITNTSFSNCHQITPTTCTFENNTISNYVGANGGSLLWPGGTTTKNCNFLNCDEGIEITQTANQTFNNLQFDDEVGNFDVHLNNGGTSIDISKNNGSNPNSYTATGGGVVTFVGAAVTATVNTLLTDGSSLDGVQVYLQAKDATGPFPYQESVTVSRSGTVATVSHTAHGMAIGDKFKLSGITDKTEDNTVFTIATVPNANSYTYTTTDSGSTSYTGTITSTFVAIFGTTTSGTISATARVYPTDQPVTGFARKSTSAPFYKGFTLNGTVDDINGLILTAVMVLDE